MKTGGRDIEHALVIYAKSYVCLPGEGIYDAEQLAKFDEIMRDCHVYLIGIVPRLSTIDFSLENGLVTSVHQCLDKTFSMELPPFPEDVDISEDSEGVLIKGQVSGRYYSMDQDWLFRKAADHLGGLDFDVKYVGQAFGKDGSRNATDRLLDHSTLQKIALKGAPEGYRIQILCLATQEENSLLTTIDGTASNVDKSGARIQSGMDKLHNTTEAEKVTLFEASLIRYFHPVYNIEYKESFPSTNLKILDDCYEKDISAIVAEISIEGGLPFRLKSETIVGSYSHIIQHNLFDEESRKAFFSREY